MIKVLKISIIIGLILLGGTKAVLAASLYFSPSSGSYEIGKNFSVNVYISSADQAMNAASGVISFPADKLEITSLSKTGSIFGLWVQEPSFSNETGTVNFEGIVLNPGFTGASGKAFTLNFKTKKIGLAQIDFTSASMLANDGKGTNILQDFSGASFGVNLASTGEEAPVATTLSAAGTPLAPNVVSPTHPAPDSWYKNNNPKFTWNVPENITATRVLYDKYPSSAPKVYYAPPIKEKELENISDGVWYFHVQLRNENGWGTISHFRFQIDTKPPEQFSITAIDTTTTTNPRPVILFNTVDDLSGISHYKIKIGDANFTSVSTQAIESNPYTLPPQDPGRRTILVQAFDKADNYTTATTELNIAPLDLPVFADYPKELQVGDTLVVKGYTYPNAEVRIWCQNNDAEPKKYTLKSDRDGNFVFVADEKMSKGIHRVWADVMDERGARSFPNEKIIVSISESPLAQLSQKPIAILTIAVSVIALLALLVTLVIYALRKIRTFKRSLRLVETDLHKVFDVLRDNLREHLKMLEKTRNRRELTEEETKIARQLKKNLDDAEKLLKKDLEDIEKKIKEHGTFVSLYN